MKIKFFMSICALQICSIQGMGFRSFGSYTAPKGNANRHYVFNKVAAPRIPDSHASVTKLFSQFPTNLFQPKNTTQSFISVGNFPGNSIVTIDHKDRLLKVSESRVLDSIANSGTFGYGLSLYSVAKAAAMVQPSAAKEIGTFCELRGLSQTFSKYCNPSISYARAKSFLGISYGGLTKEAEDVAIPLPETATAYNTLNRIKTLLDFYANTDKTENRPQWCAIDQAITNLDKTFPDEHEKPKSISVPTACDIYAIAEDCPPSILKAAISEGINPGSAEHTKLRSALAQLLIEASSGQHLLKAEHISTKDEIMRQVFSIRIEHVDRLLNELIDSAPALGVKTATIGNARYANRMYQEALERDPNNPMNRMNRLFHIDSKNPLD